MKKIFLAFALIASGFALSAQSFNIGLGGGIYSTWLVNKNVSDQGDNLDFSSTFSGQIGLNMQYYFKETIGLTMGILYTGHNQKYTGSETTLGVTTNFEEKTKLRYMDIPVLLRMGGGAKGAYFEFGPQFGFLMGAKDNGSATVAGTTVTVKDVDVKSTLKGSNVAAVLGFGVDIEASETVLVTTGLRLGYGFTDVTKQYSSATALSDAEDAGNVAFSTEQAHIDQHGVFNYKSTNRAFGGLFVSVVYKIPSGAGKGTPVPTTK